MRVNVQSHTPVTLPPRKRWGAHYTEGLLRPMHSLLLVIDYCIHHERVKVLDSTIGGKEMKFGLYTQNLCQILCLSVCLSVCLCFLKV